uniref:Uncharacterized protein n=1 Tax=Ixodes ricinus TaxID=34613 RepID=A0A6B0UPW5_IXORI
MGTGQRSALAPEALNWLQGTLQSLHCPTPAFIKCVGSFRATLLPVLEHSGLILQFGFIYIYIYISVYNHPSRVVNSVNTTEVHTALDICQRTDAGFIFRNCAYNSFGGRRVLVVKFTRSSNRFVW